jgi:hypothetical protein
MRKDMAKVIVTRPRIVDSFVRKGRAASHEVLPKRIGLRRHVQERGGFKMLNENLSALRRYLEAQAGRSWNDVYAEIAANLRATSTVQQHVRDHIKDFVNLYATPHRVLRWLPDRPWFEPLYVDPNGFLRRTDAMPGLQETRVLRQARQFIGRPKTLIRLSATRELREIRGLWYEVTLAPLPDPEYLPVMRSLTQRARRHRASASRKVEVVLHQLVTPFVLDVVTGEPVLAGPEVNDHDSWRRYRESRPDRVYAAHKRQLSKRELRRHSLRNKDVDD